MTPNTRSLSVLPLEEQPLAHFERGSIRQIIETEFELAVHQLIRSTNRPITRTYEETLHDTVVPAVYLYVLDKLQISSQENAGTFSNQHLQAMRRELHRLLGGLLADTPSSAPGKNGFLHSIKSIFRGRKVS